MLCNVSILEMRDSIAQNIYISINWELSKTLGDRSVHKYVSCNVQKVTDDAVVITNIVSYVAYPVLLLIFVLMFVLC